MVQGKSWMDILDNETPPPTALCHYIQKNMKCRLSGDICNLYRNWKDCEPWRKRYQLDDNCPTPTVPIYVTDVPAYFSEKTS